MKLACTAVILTQRMDKRLLKAIASVTQFSELLILDNASGITKKDVTHDNCKIHTLSDHPITDFSAVRNKALQLASEKWVFFLDSDEVLQPFSVRKLSKVLATTQHHGLNCTRSDFFLGKQLRYGEAGNQKIIRLLRACHTTFTGKIHEVAQVTGSTGEVPLCIDHYSHQSISNFISDVSTYATLLGAEKKNSLPRLLFELLFYPPTKCMHTYVIKGGWRDGYRGLTYSLVMSLHSLIVRITAYEQNHT